MRAIAFILAACGVLSSPLVLALDVQTSKTASLDAGVETDFDDISLVAGSDFELAAMVSSRRFQSEANLGGRLAYALNQGWSPQVEGAVRLSLLPVRQISLFAAQSVSLAGEYQQQDVAYTSTSEGGFSWQWQVRPKHRFSTQTAGVLVIDNLSSSAAMASQAELSSQWSSRTSTQLTANQGIELLQAPTGRPDTWWAQRHEVAQLQSHDVSAQWQRSYRRGSLAFGLGYQRRYGIEGGAIEDSLSGNASLSRQLTRRFDTQLSFNHGMDEVENRIDDEGNMTGRYVQQSSEATWVLSYQHSEFSVTQTWGLSRVNRLDRQTLQQILPWSTTATMAWSLDGLSFALHEDRLFTTYTFALDWERLDWPTNAEATVGARYRLFRKLDIQGGASLAYDRVTWSPSVNIGLQYALIESSRGH